PQAEGGRSRLRYGAATLGILAKPAAAAAPACHQRGRRDHAISLRFTPNGIDMLRPAGRRLGAQAPKFCLSPAKDRQPVGNPAIATLFGNLNASVSFQFSRAAARSPCRLPGFTKSTKSLPT